MNFVADGTRVVALWLGDEPPSCADGRIDNFVDGLMAERSNEVTTCDNVQHLKLKPGEVLVLCSDIAMGGMEWIGLDMVHRRLSQVRNQRTIEIKTDDVDETGVAVSGTLVVWRGDRLENIAAEDVRIGDHVLCANRSSLAPVNEPRFPTGELQQHYLAWCMGRYLANRWNRKLNDDARLRRLCGEHWDVRIPACVFGASNSVVKVFLKRFLRERYMDGYWLICDTLLLARSVRHLLVRFGVHCRLENSREYDSIGYCDTPMLHVLPSSRDAWKNLLGAALKPSACDEHFENEFADPKFLGGMKAERVVSIRERRSSRLYGFTVTEPHRLMCTIDGICVLTSENPRC